MFKSVEMPEKGEYGSEIQPNQKKFEFELKSDFKKSSK